MIDKKIYNIISTVIVVVILLTSLIYLLTLKGIDDSNVQISRNYMMIGAILFFGLLADIVNTFIKAKNFKEILFEIKRSSNKFQSMIRVYVLGILIFITYNFYAKPSYISFFNIYIISFVFFMLVVHNNENEGIYKSGIKYAGNYISWKNINGFSIAKDKITFFTNKKVLLTKINRNFEMIFNEKEVKRIKMFLISDGVKYKKSK